MVIIMKYPRELISPDPEKFFTPCPRQDVEVIIVKNVCLFTNKTDICKGCRFNGES